MQQHEQQQAVVEDLGKRVEDLTAMVKDLSSKNEFLNNQNAVLAKDLNDIKESTAMILEKAKTQNNSELAKLLREREASAAASAVAAAKIAELDEDIRSLQNAFTDQNSDTAVNEEVKRFMQIRKERGGESRALRNLL